MKNFLSRLIIITILILSSISICLSDDKGCEDLPGYSIQVETSQSSAQEQNSNHHCLCSLSCNNLFLIISAIPKRIDFLILSSSSFVFIHTLYAEVHMALDKPPIV